MSNTLKDSAYVILINDNNSMITTQKQRIIQMSKLVDNLWFLVKPEYNGYNMADFTVVLEYLSPISHTYHIELLTKHDDDYNGYLKYILPVDTLITLEAGDIELILTFLLTDTDASGNNIHRIRKITGTKINIIPVNTWGESIPDGGLVPDSALSALDQRIIKIDEQIRELNEISAIISKSKADNIVYDEDTGEVQLKAGDELIGDKIIIRDDSLDEDGVPVIDLGKMVYI